MRVNHTAELYKNGLLWAGHIWRVYHEISPLGSTIRKTLPFTIVQVQSKNHTGTPLVGTQTSRIY